jgi:hypothetical protein
LLPKSHPGATAVLRGARPEARKVAGEAMSDTPPPVPLTPEGFPMSKADNLTARRHPLKGAAAAFVAVPTVATIAEVGDPLVALGAEFPSQSEGGLRHAIADEAEEHLRARLLRYHPRAMVTRRCHCASPSEVSAGLTWINRAPLSALIMGKRRCRGVLAEDLPRSGGASFLDTGRVAGRRLQMRAPQSAFSNGWPRPLPERGLSLPASW